ncbi:rhodanese-like domain-containing protein [Alteromonadaceae bacterium BrNp21-10]|nr:rhodanese-like domain-containing protein [Alteromonadaceae bacterium BrNp21-10]
MLKNYQQVVQDAKSHIREISVDELYQQLNNSNILTIDIREPNEMATGIIPNAICLPRGILEGSLASIDCVKQAADPLAALAEYQLYIYCRSGARSALAAESLLKMGLSNVQSVAGGMDAWQQQGYPVANKGS